MINRICRFIFFRVLGWRQIGEAPTDLKKYIFAAVPHTSNWDFIYGWMATRAMNLKVTIFVKDSYFVWPLTYFCRFFGVAPVNRRENTNFVDLIARQFKQRDQLIAMITPEGTRKRVENLKSGYYHLARQANVPIVVAGPNYAQKSFTVLPPRAALASFTEDEAQIIKFCQSMVPKIAENTFR